MLALPEKQDRRTGQRRVQVDSFLVQVWVAADGTSRHAQLRGVVRHVATGTETPFRNDDEVLVVLRRAADHHPHRVTPSRPNADQDKSTIGEEVR